MPQYRKTHVKLTESFDFAEMPDDFTRLLWVMLPLKTCREGRGIDAPGWIIGQLFSLRQDVTPQMVEAAMQFYAARGMVVRYSVKGRPYFQVVNWSRYQGDTSKEASSQYPAPEDADSADDGGQDLLRTYSRVSPELVQNRSASDTNTNTDTNSTADTHANARAREAGAVVELTPEEREAKQRAWDGTRELVTFWEELTGRKQPRDDDRLREGWIVPFNDIWIACGRDTDAAKAKIQAVRDDFLARDIRIFDPAKLVGHVKAAVDADLLPMTKRLNGNGPEFSLAERKMANTRRAIDQVLAEMKQQETRDA